MLGLRRTSAIVIAVALGATTIGGGYALAAHNSSTVATVAPDGTITACVGKRSGRLRIVSQASSCHAWETVLTWSAGGAGGAGGGGPAPAATTAGITLTLSNGQPLTGGDPTGPAFEITDWSFGVENPTTIGSATGGAGAGKVKFDEFKITKRVDTASPMLFKACASGQHFKEVVITVRRAGQSTAYVTYKLETVFITSIQTGSSGGETPMETITFVYGKLTTTETPVSGPLVSFGWDQIRNIIL
jgi:type VI secretion system secreted protein Hcp